MPRNLIFIMTVVVLTGAVLTLTGCDADEPELVRVYFYNKSDIPVSSVSFIPAEGENADEIFITSVIMPGGWLEVNVRGVLFSQISANRGGGEPIALLSDTELVTGAYDFTFTGSDGVYTIDLATHVDELLPPPPTPDLGADD